MSELVYLNKYGYYELKNKPSIGELESYYKGLYYQEPKGSYQKKYSDEELLFINNKLAQKYIIVDSMQGQCNARRKFLDIGCGEGWSLKYFDEKAWEVTGLDFSTYGLKQLNNQLLDKIIEGDIYININNLLQEGKRYNCIYLLNVLEHVIDPKSLLLQCYQLLDNNGVLLIQVPNDFSRIQRHLLKEGKIDKEFWISVPDHISYFNVDGLTNLCSEIGLIKKNIISDFPIDLNLFNEDTNYIMDSKKGKNCHIARIKIENLLSSISDVKANKLYEALADLGLGRNFTIFLTKDK